MAIKFPTAVSGRLAGASWLDAQSQLSMFARVRFDAITTANKQYVFQYRLGSSGDQFSLRKDSTSDKFRASVTAGGALVTKDSASVLAASTIYNVAMSWQKNIANGLKLFLGGAEDGAGNSTTSQTADLNASSGDLVISARPGTFDYGVCTIETFILWTGYNIALAEYLALSDGAWPHQLALAPQPAIFLPCWEELLTELTDQSSNGRAVPITGSTLAGGLLGQLLDPMEFDAGRSAGVSVVVPNAWTDWVPDILHPNGTGLITGLSNGIPYEFKVAAIDASGNVGADSAIVQATPVVPAPSVSSLAVPWRRTRRHTKYKASQQG